MNDHLPLLSFFTFYHYLDRKEPLCNPAVGQKVPGDTGCSEPASLSRYSHVRNYLVCHPWIEGSIGPVMVEKGLTGLLGHLLSPLPDFPEGTETCTALLEFRKEKEECPLSRRLG